MIVKDKRGGMKKEGDQFPIGMRVLVVDDDPTCLQLIHQLLLSCKYNVSATLEGGKALKMLRENKEEFDLVITDVDMPGIDGFKLLEEVGIKMDLPVIMVSGHNNHEIVMKGIKHGACDYLAKPVRLQELGNIWQHVIRRKKIDSRDENSSDDGEGCEKSLDENTEGAHALVKSEVSDRNEKINRKRKDLNKEDEDDDGETTQENDDASTGKKQRVVWSAELHNKFAQAVNELGIDKAVPKKILDLMNVENLTRENVASHLQKYRLHLKKNTAATSQHVNMVAAFRGRQPSYLPMDAMEGFRNIHLLAGSRQLPTLVSFQPNSVLGRMNNPTGFGQHSLVPSGIYNNTSNSINDLGKHQVIGLRGIGNQHKTVQGTNKYFPGVFSGTGLATSSSSKSFSSATNNSLLLPANQQHTQSEIFGSQSSVRIPSLSLDPFKIGVGDSSLLPDIRRCNDTWQGAVPANSYPAKASPFAALSSHNNNPPDNSAPVISQMDKNLHASSSGSVAMAPLRDSLFENGILHQASSLSSGSVAMAPLCDSLGENGILNQASSLGSNTMLMPSGVNENSRFLRNSIDIWEGQNLNQNQPHNHNLLFSSTPSLPDLCIPEIIAENPMVNNGRNSSFPFLAEDRRTDLSVNYKEECTLETTNIHDGLGSSPSSFDDLISAMTRTERDDLTFFDDDLVNDIFPLGTCT